MRPQRPPVLRQACRPRRATASWASSRSTACSRRFTTSPALRSRRPQVRALLGRGRLYHARERPSHASAHVLRHGAGRSGQGHRDGPVVLRGPVVAGSRQGHGGTLLALHVLLGVYSLSDVASKKASQAAFLSPGFIGFYLVVLVLLAIYAIGWQQVIRRMPLSSAYANRASRWCGASSGAASSSASRSVRASSWAPRYHLRRGPLRPR